MYQVTILAEILYNSKVKFSIEKILYFATAKNREETSSQITSTSFPIIHHCCTSLAH